MSATAQRPPALSRSALDRAAERRSDAAWLDAAWADPQTRVLVVGESRVLVEAGPEDAGGSPRLVLLSPAEAVKAVDDGERYLLGVDPEGTVYFALAAAHAPDPAALSAGAAPATGLRAAGLRAAGLRGVGMLLSDRDAGLLVHAVALAQWHRTHPRCARCGEPTEVREAGHMRRCPACDAEHYPRTDPAVIVLITDPDDRCLLGRQDAWPPRRYSVFAGFVEPGESLEQTVRREIAEEVGVQVTDVRYVASQPWPFPSSLMLAFTARATGTGLRVDGAEISHARWYTRAELGAAVAAKTLLLPSGVSIARRLIEDWYGEPLPEDNHW